MTHNQKHRAARLACVVTTTIAVTGLMVSSSMSAQQGPALLEITSPAPGTVISPGQRITITVTSPAKALIAGIFIIGTGGIGMVEGFATSVPAEFSVLIPEDMTPRTQMLTAAGKTMSGQNVSASVEIDVERPDLPLSISTPLRQLIFDAQGDSHPIKLHGTFADRSVLDVTESSHVTYSSSNVGVATVNSYGMATPLLREEHRSSPRTDTWGRIFAGRFPSPFRRFASRCPQAHSISVNNRPGRPHPGSSR